MEIRWLYVGTIQQFDNDVLLIALECMFMDGDVYAVERKIAGRRLNPERPSVVEKHV